MILEEVIHEIESPITEYRNLQSGDVLPEGSNMIVSDEDWKADKDWIWVAVKEGMIQAIVVACPFHGAVFVGHVRNRSNDDHILVPLLRKFVSDITARGYSCLFTFLNNDLPAERKLASILDMAGGVVLPGVHIAVGAALPMKRKW